MKEVRDNVPLNLIRPVITTGTFDGLHLGHQKVILETIKIAKEQNGTPVILTFWPHPRYVLGKEEFSLLNTFEEKRQLFKEMGIDHAYYLEFTKEFAQLSSEEYVRDILVGKFGLKTLVVGYDHQFGKERSGKYETLGELASRYDFCLRRVAALDIKGLNVSSTKIRKALELGEMSEVSDMLGYHYFIQGKVVSGHRLGHTLGFPTANIQVPDVQKMIPGDGVYAVYVKVEEQYFGGMLSIGFRPTFPNQPHVKSIEVNIFDFSKDIYGEKISVYFVKKLRDEEKYEGVNLLIDQLKRDKENAQKVLTNCLLLPKKLM